MQIIIKKELYPNHFKIQDSAKIKRLKGKALIEENGYSIVEINNATYKPLKFALSMNSSVVLKLASWSGLGI